MVDIKKLNGYGLADAKLRGDVESLANRIKAVEEKAPDVTKAYVDQQDSLLSARIKNLEDTPSVPQTIIDDVNNLKEGAEEITEKVDKIDGEISDMWNVVMRNHPDDYLSIRDIVRSGRAKEFFEIGDQIVVPWEDTAAGTTYEMPFDVVHFGNAELEDGTVVPAMYLQSHYTSPFGVQFSQNQAFYVAEDVLPRGTYNFKIGTTWSKCIKDKVYSFTISEDLPVGGMLQIGLANSEIGACPDQDPVNWRIRVYVSQTAQTPREILTLTESTDGTQLGVISSSTKFESGDLNNLQSSSYGYNRYSHSAIRQYLNSSENKGAWWSPQNKYDRPPIELFTKDGFLKGLPQDFIDAIGRVKVRTALNTVTDSNIGTYEDVYDKFFLPSLEEEYCVPQLAGVEGEVWEYWRERIGTQNPQGWYGDNALTEHIRYAVNAKTSPQNVRLRSAHRGSSFTTWYVYSAGTVGSYGTATTSHRFAPACAIC